MHITIRKYIYKLQNNIIDLMEMKSLIKKII